ncbi:MAG: tetratricopeptide repeat protein [Cryomorphaceae bacterium]|nr:tetratricopeptide repeat protein [Cryomorphaceae bacterium]
MALRSILKCIKGMTIRLSLFCFLFPQSHIIQAYNPPGKVYQQQYAKLWQLRLSEVNEGLKGAESAHIKGLQLFAEIYIRENSDIYEKKLPEFQAQIKILKADPSPFSQTAHAELTMMQAALRLKFNQYMKAGFDFWSGYRKAKSNFKDFPDYPPAKMMWGIIEAGLGSLPEHIQSYLSIIGFSGDVEVGLEMLHKALQTTKTGEWNYAYPLMGLAYVSAKVQLDNDQNISLKSIGLNPSQSPILTAIEAKILFDRSQAEAAYNLLENRKGHPNEIPFPYLFYLQGRMGVTLQNPKGNKMLELYLLANEGQLFIKSSHRYLWWHYHLKGNDQKAEHHRKKILEEGTTETGPDQLAQYEANKRLNKHLLIARLTFDRGEFRKCLSHLTAKKADEVCQSDEEKGEYYYRMGRCLQSLGNRNPAINRYKQSIEKYGDLETFERSNALLQMGLLQEKNGNCEDAISQFKAVTSFSGFPFSEGQHQKAKAGIRRCKKQK